MPFPLSFLRRREARPPVEVAPGVSVIVVPFTRVYVLHADGTNPEYSEGDFFLVDSGVRSDRIAILRALQLAGLQLKNCRALMLTHAHPDHAGNAAFFAQRGVPIFLGEKERNFLETRRTYIPRGPRFFLPLGLAQGAMFVGGEAFWPVQRILGPSAHRLHSVRENDILPTPCGDWRVLETPGHTRGHVSYFREADGTLLSGDAILNVVPFIQRIDLAIPTAIFNENTPQTRESARRLCALPVQTLLPGHGPSITENTAEKLRHFAQKHLS